MRIELLLLCTLFGSLFISSIFMGVRLSEIARDLRQYCFHPIFGPFHRSSFNSNGGSLFPPTIAPSLSPFMPANATDALQSYSAEETGESPVSETRDPYQYVHDDFLRHNCTVHKFVTTDTEYEPVVYHLRENILWNHRSVCRNDTFVLLMYLVNRKDLQRRQFIRQRVHQGMVVDGKVVNYVIVVALDENDEKGRRVLDQENVKHRDLLISVHKDTYVNVTLTVLDAFLWARDYCQQPSFVARIDGDTWVHLGNLVRFLRHVPATRFYGGYPYRSTLEKRSKATYPGYVPDDYPPQRCFYNAGGAYILSRDLVPYFNIGTLYVDLVFRAAEDALLGVILSKVDIWPYFSNLQYIVYTNYEWLPGLALPPNVIFIHNLKNMTLMTTVHNHFANLYTIPYRVPASSVCFTARFTFHFPQAEKDSPSGRRNPAIRCPTSRWIRSLSPPRSTATSARRVESSSTSSDWARSSGRFSGVIWRSACRIPFTDRFRMRSVCKT